MKKNIIKKMALASVMAAFAIVLNLISVRSDTSLYTIYALPLLLAGILYGPLVGFYAGLATGIIVQLFTYGITPTTVLWVLAPTAWGLISGFISYLFSYKITKPKVIINIAICTLSVLILNTLAQILDGLYYQYSTAFVWINIHIRVLVSIVIGIFYIVVIYLTAPRLKKITNVNDSNTKQSNEKKSKLKVNLTIEK